MATFSTELKLTERSAAGARPTNKRSKKGTPCAMLYRDTATPGFGLAVYEGALRQRGAAKSTIDDYRYLLEKYLAAWLDRELVTLSRKEVRERHTAIAREIARGKHARKRSRGEGFGGLTANQAMRAFR